MNQEKPKRRERRYPEDVVGELDDDGTMPANVLDLEEAVIGRKIVKAEPKKLVTRWGGWTYGLILTLDNGDQVQLLNTSDCCAYTDLEAFVVNPDLIDHAILGVETTDGYTTWHIYADLGDVMQLKVGWSCGNLSYYGYGFDIRVNEDFEVVDDD